VDGADAVTPYHESYWDFTQGAGYDANWLTTSGKGDFIANQGFVSEPLGIIQALSVYTPVYEGMTVAKIKVEVLVSSGASGEMYAFCGIQGVEENVLQYSGNVIDGTPGYVIVDFDLFKPFLVGALNNLGITYTGDDNDPAHIITLTRMWIVGIGIPELRSTYHAHIKHVANYPTQDYIEAE